MESPEIFLLHPKKQPVSIRKPAVNIYGICSYFQLIYSEKT